MAKTQQETVISKAPSTAYLFVITDHLGPYSPNGSDENASHPSNSGTQIEESHILQERKIGVFGAVSLIVNKIVGAG